MAPTNNCHVALLSSPGMGHLIPLAELARRLVDLHGLSVTLFVNPGDPSSSTYQDLITTLTNSKVNAITLPQPPLDSLQLGDKPEIRVFSTVNATFGLLRGMLTSLNSASRLAALIGDPFYLDAIDIAEDLGVPFYVFFTSSAISLSLVLNLPLLDAAFPGQFRDLPEPVRLPGCVPVRGEDFFDAVQDRFSDFYVDFLKTTRRFRELHGVLLNSFEELEPGAIRGFKEMEGVPPVYPVGPLIKAGSAGQEEGGQVCVRWLDGQPEESVVYVSFGSGGTLTWRQTEELALGLEMSGHRFLWVAKSPDEKEAHGTFFSSTNGDAKSPLGFLPDGFLERTKDLGLVVPNWAPQAAVLAHGSTAAFLSHCGWNSTLESVANGVPMIAWPLYAEQRLNAVELSEDANVALRPEVGGDGLVRREEIARVIKCLMEGEEGKRVRSTARKLKDASAQTLGESGSSFTALSKIVKQWKGQLECMQ